MKTALIIGGGFTGCAAAHHLVQRGGWDITLVEAQPYLGAGNKTRWYGGHPYTYGPRHFLTQDESIYRYLHAIVPLRSCADHEFLTYVERDSAFYHYPIHRDDIAVMPDRDQIEAELASVGAPAAAGRPDGRAGGGQAGEGVQLSGAAAARNFEEYWIRSVGETLYRKFIDGYSKKMWMLDDNRMIDDFTWSPKGVTIKEGPRSCWNTAISAFPIAADGYDRYFGTATAGATVLLSTRIEHYDIPRKTVRINGQERRFDVIINTISPDILFDACHGELPYIGRELIKIVLPVEFAFPEHVYFCYYANQESFTRIVEYKKFTHHKAPTSLITLEIPSRKNKLYPMPIEAEKSKADRYFREMPDGVFSIGRAGAYLYNVDIDDAIDHAKKTVEKIAS